MGIKTQYLLNSSGLPTHSAIGAGMWSMSDDSDVVIEAFLDGNGGSATIEVQGANTTDSPGSVMATFILSGANDIASVGKPDVMYKFRRAVVKAISGGALCKVVIGGE